MLGNVRIQRHPGRSVLGLRRVQAVIGFGHALACRACCSVFQLAFPRRGPVLYGLAVAMVMVALNCFHVAEMKPVGCQARNCASPGVLCSVFVFCSYGGPLILGGTNAYWGGECFKGLYSLPSLVGACAVIFIRLKLCIPLGLTYRSGCVTIFLLLCHPSDSKFWEEDAERRRATTKLKTSAALAVDPM